MIAAKATENHFNNTSTPQYYHKISSLVQTTYIVAPLEY